MRWTRRGLIPRRRSRIPSRPCSAGSASPLVQIVTAPAPTMTTVRVDYGKCDKIGLPAAGHRRIGPGHAGRLRLSASACVSLE